MRKKMEQILLEDGELFTAASGISMLPCIRPQKDILHLVRPEGIVETSEVILSKEEWILYSPSSYRKRHGRIYPLWGSSVDTGARNPGGTGTWSTARILPRRGLCRLQKG